MRTAGMRQAGSRRPLGTTCTRSLVLVVGVRRSRSMHCSMARATCGAVGRRSDLTVTKNPEMFSAGGRGPRQETCQRALRGQGERTIQQQTREEVSYKDTLRTCTT